MCQNLRRLDQGCLSKLIIVYVLWLAVTEAMNHHIFAQKLMEQQTAFKVNLRIISNVHNLMLDYYLASAYLDDSI